MRIDQAVFEACTAGDFQQASLLFRESCALAELCGCSEKTVDCAARCLSARLTYLSLAKNDDAFHSLATRVDQWSREARAGV